MKDMDRCTRCEDDQSDRDMPVRIKFRDCSADERQDCHCFLSSVNRLRSYPLAQDRLSKILWPDCIQYKECLEPFSYHEYDPYANREHYPRLVIRMPHNVDPEIQTKHPTILE
ncbi:MAG: hypothetical protein WA604_06195 [Candidatus Sulfotelmatobacter sp.]